MNVLDSILEAQDGSATQQLGQQNRDGSMLNDLIGMLGRFVSR